MVTATQGMQDWWAGEELRVLTDEPTGSRLIVAIHSTRRGPATGGTRMRAYASLADAIDDALRLSEGMTRKNAVAGLPAGGGKAVLAIPGSLPTSRRRQLLLRYAHMVESFDGRFWTGPDMGTTEKDMDLLGTVSSHILCRTPEAGGSGVASPWTAAGVRHGIRAAVRQVFGRESLAGLRFAVQGAGDVGGRLVRLLVRDGAEVLVSDVDSARVEALISEVPAVKPVDPSDVLSVDCDVFAPCAIGGILNAGSIPSLKAAIVAGAANNQLSTPSDADLLRRRGVLYAPDYVINAGGIIRALGKEQLHWTEDEIDRRVAAIGDTLGQVFGRADRDDISTAAAADAIAAEAQVVAV